MKIINLFEFQRPIEQDLFFPIASSTWIMRPSGLYEGVLYDVIQPELLTPTPFFSMYGVEIKINTEITILSEKDTYAEVVSTESAWAFIDGTLYVHFPDSKTPYHYSSGEIIIQAFTGYYTSTGDKELDAFGGLYDPRLQTFPLYRSQLDDFTKGKQALAGGTVVLDNSDGELNNFSFGRDPDTLEEVLPKIGWYGRIRQAIINESATPTDTDFKIITQGYTSKITENVTQGAGRGVSIELKDIRGSLDKDIPIYEVDPTDWTEMSSKDIEKPPLIPIAYGTLNRVPCFCLNETRTSGAFKFLICDSTENTITSIDKVYIEDRETTLTPTISYLTQTNGRKVAYFEIASSAFIVCTDPTAPSFDYQGYTAVSIDMTGYSIDNALDVTKDLILQTYGETYDADFYDTTAWASMTAKAPDIGLYIDKITPLNTVIQDIQKSFPLTSFIVNTDQKYTWVDYLWDDDLIKFEIKPDGLPIGYIPSPQVNADEIGAKIQIDYSKRYSINEYISLINEDNLQTAFDKYNTDRTFPPDFNTLLSSETDAEDMIDRLKTVYFYPQTYFYVTIPMAYKSMGIYAYDLRAGDFVKFLANSATKNIYGYLGCIIQEIKQNITSMTLDITLNVMYNSGLTYKQPVIINTYYNGKYLGDGAFIFGGIK